MSKKRELSSEEKKLWRRVAATVRARKPALAADDDDAREPPVKAARTTRSPQPAPSPKRTAASAPPANRGGEKRVRRGKLEIGGTLDLHGHTQESGRAALGRFLRAAQRRGDRAVIVVTGMGRGGEGVLKRRLPEWLGEHELRTLTTGYAPAHRTHGGAGALYVFVKRGD